MDLCCFTKVSRYYFLRIYLDRESGRVKTGSPGHSYGIRISTRALSFILRGYGTGRVNACDLIRASDPQINKR